MTDEKINVDEGQENSSSEEIVDNKSIFDAEQLEQEKRKSNDFRVENNSIDNQVNIQGAENINVYIQRMKSVEPKPTEDERYNLCKKEECIKFVEKYKNTDYFSVAFILSIFEAVNVSDLPMLKECLASRFLNKFLNNESQDKEKANFMCNPFISLESIVSLINGKYYEDNDKKYIGLGENYLEVTKIMFEQFPDLRAILVSFMNEVLRKKEMHESIYRSEIAEFLKFIRNNNLVDFDNKILPILYSDSINIGLLGLLYYYFYEDKKTLNYAKNTIDTWFYGSERWLWKSACIVYVYLMEADITVSFEDKLADELARRVSRRKRGDYSFLSESLMYSKPFQLLIGRVLSKEYRKERSKKGIIQVYINLVRYCYYRVNKRDVELALVVCDTREQLIELKEIIAAVMVNYEFRVQIYFVLQAYIKELVGYKYQPKLIKYIAAYCHALSNGNKAYIDDIVSQIKKIQNKVANEIVDMI